MNTDKFSNLYNLLHIYFLMLTSFLQKKAELALRSRK